MMFTGFPKVLITGATGNVGLALINVLQQQAYPLEIVAGVRNIESDRKKIPACNVNFVKFDFSDLATYGAALKDCKILFLLRPPQLSNVKKYINPIIQAAQEHGVEHIIFLSVQGAERSKIIPHNKIERLIVASRIPFTFLRPAYFMQNFITSLKSDLVSKQMIFLPSGNTRFTMIDVSDIAKVTAVILGDVSMHRNKTYELTCSIKLSFSEMAQQLSMELDQHIAYISPNLLSFYLAKRKEHIPAAYIFVMIMLHYLPRFQKEPPVTDCVERLVGEKPVEFVQFIKNNKTSLQSLD